MVASNAALLPTQTSRYLVTRHGLRATRASYNAFHVYTKYNNSRTRTRLLALPPRTCAQSGVNSSLCFQSVDPCMLHRDSFLRRGQDWGALALSDTARFATQHRRARYHLGIIFGVRHRDAEEKVGLLHVGRLQGKTRVKHPRAPSGKDKVGGRRNGVGERCNGADRHDTRLPFLRIAIRPPQRALRTTAPYRLARASQEQVSNVRSSAKNARNSFSCKR